MKVIDSNEGQLDPEFEAKVSEAIEEYKKPYSFGKNVIDNEDSNFDILNDLIRYLHTRFDENSWEENKVFNKLPAWYRNAYLVWTLDAEVQNGGLAQYFTNSAGEHARDTVIAFGYMSEQKLCEFMEEALKTNALLDRLEKFNADEDEMLEHEQELHRLDNRYYDGLDKLLYETVDSYIKQQMKNSGEVSFITP